MKSRRTLVKIAVSALALAGAVGVVIRNAPAQGRGGALSADAKKQRNDLEAELESIAIIDRKVMVPMRDGKRMATDIYRPKDTSKKYPIIFVRTPYNFNFWDVRNGTPRDMSAELDAVKRGYAYVEMNERGHFFSEGNYDILGAPLTDGVDAITWMSTQPWSNGKVGTIGCSSTAEWQLGVAAQGEPGIRGHDPAGLRRGRGPRRARTMSRATGIAAAPCRCSSSPGSTASRTRSGRCFRRTRRRTT